MSQIPYPRISFPLESGNDKYNRTGKVGKCDTGAMMDVLKMETRFDKKIAREKSTLLLKYDQSFILK